MGPGWGWMGSSEVTASLRPCLLGVLDAATATLEVGTPFWWSAQRTLWSLWFWIMASTFFTTGVLGKLSHNLCILFPRAETVWLIAPGLDLQSVSSVICFKFKMTRMTNCGIQLKMETTIFTLHSRHQPNLISTIPIVYSEFARNCPARICYGPFETQFVPNLLNDETISWPWTWRSTGDSQR